MRDYRTFAAVRARAGSGHTRHPYESGIPAMARLAQLVRALLWLGLAAGGVWLWLVLTDIRGEDLKPLWTGPRLVKVQARVEQVSRSDGYLQVRYRYTVGEQTYRSERLTFDPQRGRSDSGTLADLFLVYDSALRHSLPVEAWVDPRDPAFAVLHRNVQWLPVTATAAALALLALVIAFALRRGLQALGLRGLADVVLSPEAPADDDRVPWAAYRAAVLLVATANVAVWSFIPGSALSLLATLAAAVTLAVPLPWLYRRWGRWRGRHRASLDGDRHWTLLADRHGRGVQLHDRTAHGGAWLCGGIALAVLAWVGYVLLARPFHADILGLLLAMAVGLGAAALAFLLHQSAVSITISGDRLRVERGRGLRVERVATLRLRDVADIECLPDPLGHVAVDATGHWRVSARLASDGTAVPLTPLVSADSAQAAQDLLTRSLELARRSPLPEASDRVVRLRHLAPLGALALLGVIGLVLAGHWQWQRHLEGTRRVLPDGSMLVRKPERDPLQRALYARDIAAVRAALATGLSPDRLDDQGRRPLHVAAMLKSPDLVTTLIQAGADVNARLVPDRHGRRETPLMWAAGQPALVERLLAAGADPQLREDSGASAMHFAARHNSPAVLAMLHARGLPIDDHGAPDGATPLMWAFWWWAPAAIDWLVEHGAKLEGSDTRGFEMSHYVRTSKEPELAQARWRQLRERNAR